MPTYRDRLKAHPGKGSAWMMTFLGAGVGLSGGAWQLAVLGAAVFGGFCWAVVLWTARTQPVGGE